MIDEGEPSGWLTLFRPDNIWHHHARRNQSNCSVIEIDRSKTQQNLIERLGSIKFGNRTKKIAWVSD